MDESRIQEARRAKALAVEKYNAGDLNGAKELAVKANNLDPKLLGVRRLNAILDVYIAYEKKINGEVDWYGILSADPTQDLGTVHKRYNELSMAIISDRDNSIGGTDEATNILASAYRYLFEEKKKQVRERHEAQPSSRVRFRNVVPPSGVIGPVNQLGMINGGERKRKEPLLTNKLHVPQLRRISEDAGIRGETLELTPSLVQVALDDSETRLDMYIPTSQYMNIGAASVTETLQEECDADKRVKIVSEVDPDMVDMNVLAPDFSNFDEDRMEASQCNNIGAAAETFQESKKCDGGERVKIVNELEDPNVVDMSVLDPDFYDKDRIEASQCNNIDAAGETFQDSNNCDGGESVDIVNEEDPNEVDMSVPDPDFYDFDKDRTEDSFGENEMWAVYDEYGMPRFYALVHKVVSREPFKLCISWLNSKKNEELGPMKWIDSGYHKTSGNFSIGRRNNYNTLHSFSHRVKWQIGVKGLVHIYPRKGNVWALFKNWSPSWDFYTSLEVMNQYEMVQVLEDFDEEGRVAVQVVPLVKVPGFHTIFRRHPNQRTYPRRELFRFSHQVAFHLLTGEEGKNAPKGCLELDPAAMSPELLKAFTEEEMREKENAVK